MKKLIRFMAFMLVVCCCSFSCAEEHSAVRIVYGQSQMGRDLECWQVGSEDAACSMLMVFGIHGFEDIYDHDADILKEIAEKLIRHYEEQPPEACLYIIPSANPDGLIDGVSKDDFGRLTAAQIDPNRDFPVRWSENSKTKNLRNRTGTKAFSCPETRAIGLFTLSHDLNWGIDVHGYINAVYGTGQMAKSFAKTMNMPKKQWSSGGMMCEWFDAVLDEGIMIELPSFRYNEAFDRDAYISEYAEKLITSVDTWLKLNTAAE